MGFQNSILEMDTCWKRMAKEFGWSGTATSECTRYLCSGKISILCQKGKGLTFKFAISIFQCQSSRQTEVFQKLSRRHKNVGAALFCKLWNPYKCHVSEQCYEANDNSEYHLRSDNQITISNWINVAGARKRISETILVLHPTWWEVAGNQDFSKTFE